MMPEMVAAGVPPGMAIMSRLVEPLVMASCFSRDSAPERVAAPMLESARRVPDGDAAFWAHGGNEKVPRRKPGLFP